MSKNKAILTIIIAIVLLPSIYGFTFPAEPYVIIEAASVNTTAFAINNCVINATDTAGQWVLYATTGTAEVRRAQIYKTLFFGSALNAHDGRAKTTYITNITAIKTTVTRDIGATAYYGTATGDCGSGCESDAMVTITPSSSVGTNTSIWWAWDAFDADAFGVYTPDLTTNIYGSFTDEGDVTGTDRTSAERENVTAVRIDLSDDTASGTRAAMFALTTAPNATVTLYLDAEGYGTIIHYPKNHSVPAFTDAYGLVTLSSYNVTSATSGEGAWNTNQSTYVYVYDPTPTITFTTDLPSDCAIALTNTNYTNMTTEDANTECATANTTSHTCTLPSTQDLQYFGDNIYISCITRSGEENATSSSGALAINLLSEPIINDVSLIKNSDKSIVTNPYKELIYISANVTDEYSNTDLHWVNITVNKSTEYLINNVNATKDTNMSIWNTTTFRFNETGTWEITIVAKNGNTTTTYSENVVISDALSPNYISHLPASMTQSTQATFSITYYDASNITSATFTLTDPDGSTVFNDEAMTYYSSVANANGTRNTTFRKTYTPMLPGNYIIVNKTATDTYGNVYTNTTPITISSAIEVVIPTDLGGGGGGGGDSTPTITYKFTLSPTLEQTTVAPGNKKTLEFSLTNEEQFEIQVKVAISGEGDESRNWVKFQNGLVEDTINITTASGLISNKKLVRYTIDVPEDALEKEYHFSIIASSKSESKSYNVTLTVGSTWLTWFDQDFWSTELEFCPDNSFETTGELCENPKVYKLGFGIKEIVIVLVLAIIVTVYMDVRGKKR